MATTIPTGAPAGAPAQTAAPAVQRPYFWLLLIVAVALGVRYLQIGRPMEQDEFAAVYAVVERRTDSPFPTAADPLLPVASWDEVRARSVVPYGITNPVPLYHYVLYGFLQVLPPSEWALRLPSLLAGLGCVVGIFFLCRRWLGDETALAAALLTAVEPMQTFFGATAQPYALGSLACVLSFLALLGVLYAERAWQVVASAIAYAACVAFVGYLNPVLLVVVTAHLGMAAYAAASAPREVVRPLAWLGGCALAGLLLLPQLGYFLKLRAFTAAHQDYLFEMYSPSIFTFFKHNGLWMLAMVVLVPAGYVVRRQLMGGDEAEGDAAKAEAAAPKAAEAPPPDSPELVWLARCWFFVPQLAVMLLAYGLMQPVFFSRAISYTTLGGMILLAYYATRDPARDVRLAVVGLVAVMLLGVDFFARGPWTVGEGSQSWDGAAMTVDTIQKKVLEAESWKAGDVILARSAFPESDFWRRHVPEENRARVAGLLASPLTTLYVTKDPAPMIFLNLSSRRGDPGPANPPKRPYAVQTVLGHLVDPDDLLNEELAARLRPHTGFWIADLVPQDPNTRVGQRIYLNCLVPWLANALGCDLRVARTRERNDPERYFTVYPPVGPNDYVAGLSDSKSTDFKHWMVLVRRKPPQGAGMTAFGAAAAAANGHVTAPVWLVTESRPPRQTRPPEDPSAAPGAGN